MANDDARERAINECVRQLFTNGFGDKADRLVLAKTIEPEGFRDLGGRNKDSVTKIVRGVFDAGYAAAEDRIADLKKEVERLKNILRQVPNNCDKCGHSQRHHGGYGGGSGCTFWCCSCLDYLNYIERLCEGIEF